MAIIIFKTKPNLLIKTLAVLTFAFAFSSGHALAETETGSETVTDNTAELTTLANYLAVGMACSTITEAADKATARQKFIDLTNNLVNKTYFYTEQEREFIQATALDQSQVIAEAHGIKAKCLTLAESI